MDTLNDSHFKSDGMPKTGSHEPVRQLVLKFCWAGKGSSSSNSSEPFLCESHFRHELLAPEKQPVSPDSQPAWTMGSRSLCLLLVNACLERLNGNTKFEILGEDAAPLFRMIRRPGTERTWVREMFGSIEKEAFINRLLYANGKEPTNGKPWARQIVGLNHTILDPLTDIELYCDERQITRESMSLELLREGIRRTLQQTDSSAVSQRALTTWRRLLTDESIDAQTKPSHLALIHQGRELSAQPIRIAETDLIVIRAILDSWGIAEKFNQLGIEVAIELLPWSDRVLEQLTAGNIDIAIYNRSRIETYVANRPNHGLKIICDVGYSMGGRNFYILTKHGVLGAVEDRRKLAEQLHGGTVVLPIGSDLQDGFLDFLGLNESEIIDRNIKLVDMPATAGLQVFDLNQDVLLLGGQNTRFLAMYKGGYENIVDFNLLSDGSKKTFIERSLNSVVVGKRVSSNPNLMPTIETVINHANTDFRQKWNDREQSDELLHRMIERMLSSCESRQASEFIIRSILYETYRFGKPIA